MDSRNLGGAGISQKYFITQSPPAQANLDRSTEPGDGQKAIAIVALTERLELQ